MQKHTRRFSWGPIACAALLISGAATMSSGVQAAQQQAPTATPVGLPEAMGRLQAGDAVGAVTLLREVTEREPKNARAWRMLGFASLKTKDYAGAITAYQRALTLEPETPSVLYNLGVAYARKQDKDQAFAWLEKAKASRGLDMTMVATDDDLGGLRDDPRFTALLPKPADFADPFVEKVQILREWDGEAAGDQFGWIARNLGDVDGDGVNDIVTSAPTKDIGGAGAGRIYVYSGKTGKLLWTADGRPGDNLGIGLEGAGDTNGDGIPDVIAGAPNISRAYIYSGRDGKLLRTLSGVRPKDAFGTHVSGVGDVDHDGCADVIVGAPGGTGTDAGPGKAYVYSGKDGHLLLALVGERAGDAFGSSVAGYTDAKRILLMVGAPAAGPHHAGRVSVYDGLTTTPKFMIDSDQTGRALGGMFLSAVGDVNGDGVVDIYASDFSNGAHGPSTGRIYVYSGKNGRRLKTLTGTTAGEGFGIGPANAGDVDGDGYDDLIVGAWQYAGAAGSGGRASLYSGESGQRLKTYTCRIPGDTFGFDATGMGDVDGDGTLDFLITSAWSGIQGFHTGRMFLISSGVKVTQHQK